jgi:Flp pilus assembly protein CpaB
MATALLSPTRAIRQPRRLDLRAVFGLFLLLVATVGSIAFWSASSDTRAVVVATRELPAGFVLGPADLAVTRVRVDDAIYQATWPAAAREELIGKQLAEPVHAQQLLVRAQVSSRSPLTADQLALTIPIRSDTAVGGRLRPGDHVQVLSTTGKGKPESETFVVLRRVRVHDVGRDERVTVVNTASAGEPSPRPAAQGAVSTLTLVVTQGQALELARARWNGELDVALLPAPEP